MSARRTLGAALRGVVRAVVAVADNADAVELARLERDEARDAYEAASEAIRELTYDERMERAKVETFRVGLSAVHQDLVDVRRELDAARLAAKADDEVHVATCAALETVRGERDWAIARKAEIETERDAARAAEAAGHEREAAAQRVYAVEVEQLAARAAALESELETARELGEQARARNSGLEQARNIARRSEAAAYERAEAVERGHAALHDKARAADEAAGKRERNYEARIAALESELAARPPAVEPKPTRAPWVSAHIGMRTCVVCCDRAIITGSHPVTGVYYCIDCNDATKAAWEAGL